MSDITLKTAGQLQKGNYVIIDGVASQVSSIQTSRPGKHGHAKCRIEAVGLIDGKKRQVIAPGHESMECPIIGKKNAQVLSIPGEKAQVMDMESFETFEIKIPEEFKDSLTEGDTILYWQILNDKVMKQIVKG